MVEWFKAHAWKACDVKASEGSNPFLSANNLQINILIKRDLLMEKVNSTKRMNKEELIDLINSLPIDKEEFFVISSGALVLRDLLPDAGDLDIAVSVKGLEQLKEHFTLKPKNDEGVYIVNDKVECACDGPKETWVNKPEVCNGIQVQDINEYYEHLLTSKREKDKIRVPIVEQYIKNRKTHK